MDSVTLSDSEIKARKHHQCNHCSGRIVPSETYRRAVYAYDGTAYTWKTHLDCEKLYVAWLKFHELRYYHFDNGFPPLMEAWRDGDFDMDCDTFRGKFPHAVTRMEYQKQMHNIRYLEWQEASKAKRREADA